MTLTSVPDAHTPTREDVLAGAIAGFAEELKLIDPVELICLAQEQKHSNLSDLIESAAELFFQRGTLRYGGGVEVELSWETAPRILLDMEFQNDKIVALFQMELGHGAPRVDICHVMNAADLNPEDTPGGALARSLSAARCAPAQPCEKR